VEATSQVPTMRARVMRGLVWKVVSEVFGQSSGIVIAILLARLLTPHDFGLAAMVIVFAALVPIFSDLALGAALVQWKNLTEEDRSTVFWTSTGTGLGFTLLGIGLSWPVAAFYGEPAVQPLFAALSLTFVVTALGTTQSALLNREMDFKSLELRMMAGGAAGGAIGIATAALGYGAWAIILQQLSTAVVSTSLLWRFSSWRPRFVFSRASLRRLGGFSGNVFGTRILFYLNRNIDNLLVGRFIGPASLGVYAVSYNVMLSPLSRLAWPIQGVLFPAFARMQDELERMTSVWYRVNRTVGALTIPGMLGLAIVAPEFVRVVLGDRWHAAVPVIQILAWVGLLQSLQSLNSSILQARDRTRVLLWYAFVAFAGSLVGFLGGLHWGIVGVATGYAISSSFVEPYYTTLTARALGVSPWSFVRNLSGVLQASVGMAVCVVVARILLPDGMADLTRLVALIAVGIAVYVPLCALRAPEVLADVRTVLRRGERVQVVRVPLPAEH
jgi:O-antigen/teichoic acid export membrane protein